MSCKILQMVFKEPIVATEWLYFVSQLKGKFKGFTRRTGERNYTSVWLFDLHLVQPVDVLKLEARLEGVGVTKFQDTEYLFNIIVSVKGYSLHMVKSHYVFDTTTQLPRMYNKLDYYACLDSASIKCLKGEMIVPTVLRDDLQLSIRSNSHSVGKIVRLR